MPVCDFLKEKKLNNRICILRHDVDRGINCALKTAELENKMKIRASYYFRYPKTFKKDVIEKIQNLGHEIGYHYETLAKAKGDMFKARDLFKKELQDFREIAPVSTIAAHGSPASKWDNKKMWADFNFKDFNILGEAYLSVDFDEVFYITDTGRGWNRSQANIRDTVVTKLNLKFYNTGKLIQAIKNDELPGKIMLSIHPNRWNDNLILWSLEFFGQNAKNIVKKLIKHG